MRALIAALDDPCERVRAQAVWALAQTWPPVPDATPHFIRLLRDPDLRTRQGAINGLGNMEPVPAEAVGPLIASFDHPDAQTAHDAIRTVGAFGEAAKAAVPRLKRALRDRRYSSAAAHALGGIGPSAAEAVPALCGALRSRDAETRNAAVEALGEIGPAAVEAIPALLASLDDERFLARVETQWQAEHEGPASEIGVYPTTAGNLRAHAALALWRIAEHERAVPILMAGLGDANRGGRRAAAEALRLIGPPAVRAAAILAQAACSDPDPATRQDALQALDAFGPDAASLVGAMIYALGDDDWSVRGAAIDALTNLGPAAQSAIAQLWQIVRNRDDGLRVSAAGALWRIAGDLATIAVFVEEMADEHPDAAECRETCARWLAEIGPPASSALPALHARLADDDERVVSVAAEAIQRITGRSPWN